MPSLSALCLKRRNITFTPRFLALHRATPWQLMERCSIWRQLLRTSDNSEVWAENCPENFENRAALVGAEIARIENRDLDAMRLYEKAIHSSRTNGFVNNEALAYERASDFYRARGFDQIRRHLPAQCPRLLRIMGRGWKSEATRPLVSRP